MSDCERIEHVTYQLHLAVHYHMRRQQFFESWHRITGVITLVFSTSAIAVITNDTFFGVICAAIVALFQCIDLILDTRGKSELHNELRRDYLTLHSEFLGISTNSESRTKALIEIEKQIKKIELKEPPIKKVLLEVSHNDACRVLDYDKEEMHKINWFIENTCNLINWPSQVKTPEQ